MSAESPLDKIQVTDGLRISPGWSYFRYHIYQHFIGRAIFTNCWKYQWYWYNDTTSSKRIWSL